MLRGEFAIAYMDGAYDSFQLSELVDRTEIIMTAQRLLDLTYEHAAKTLNDQVGS